MIFKLWSVIIWLKLLQVGCQSVDLLRRSLASCSSYTSCSSCQNDSLWTYLNGACASSSSSTVASDAYSFSTENAYWSSYTSSGYIYLNSSGSNSLSLYQLSSANLADHPTCYWRIINSYNLQMTVQIQRSSMNYEDIYVLYSYNNSNYCIQRNQVFLRDQHFDKLEGRD